MLATRTIKPTQPRPRFPGDFILQMRRSPLDFLTHLAEQHGDFVHFRIGKQNMFLLNHPNYVKEMLVTQHKHLEKGRALQQARRVLGNGLLTNEGKSHLKQRRLMQPAFHRNRIAAYAADMVGYSQKIMGDWQDGDVVEMHDEVQRLTLAIVGKTLLNTDIESDAQDVGEALNVLTSQFGKMLMPFSELLMQLPLPGMRRLAEAQDRLDGLVYRLIEERLQKGDQGDLLSMLLMAQEDGEGMSMEQVRDEVMTILLAGHETTANSLTWTFALLAQHPEVAQRLQLELDEVLNGSYPTLENLPNLPYLDKVLKESLRLYPPAWAIGRTAVSDISIGNYHIPAGSALFVSQWVMHRDGRYYANPDRFDPERWTQETATQRPKFAYFPFGAGARFCIGERFAWMEMGLILATIAQSWQLDLTNNQPIVPQAKITLRPKNGLRVKLIAR